MNAVILRNWEFGPDDLNKRPSLNVKRVANI